MKYLIKLIIRSNRRIISKFSLGNDLKHIVIGSRADASQIVINKPTVSRKHAEINIANDNRIYIKDLNSSNGTYLNKKRIRPGVNTEIRIGDVINLGPSLEAEILIQAPVSSVDSDKTVEQKNFVTPGKKLICIGRSSSCDISLNSELVSRKHAFISQREDGGYTITDNNSTNGTYVNGHLLTGSKSIRLTDQIKIGNHTFTLQDYFSNKQIKPSVKKIDLVSILNRKSELLIGRSKFADFRIKDNSVSKKHAKIFKKGNGFFIQDLHSTNGTFVNGKKLKPGKSYPLKKTDKIRISFQIFNITGETTNLSEYSAITANSISKTYPGNNYTAVKPISFSIPAKSFIALMGPSGCGKSTLMDMLNGSRPATKGQVLIHGLDLMENLDLLKQKIGYVPQDDIVHKNLTVNKALYYAAKLRMNKDTTDKEIWQRIDEVCNNLKITKEQRTNFVSKLSGGQRKRVSIAVELLNKPTILFLDEPTSPLDPETIDSFLTSIRDLAHKEETTVVMVTHKPGDLKYVDRVIFMGAKGFTTFYGNENELTSYFKVDNIIKVYAKLSKPEVAKEWYQKWIAKQEKETYKIDSSEVSNKQKVSLFSQFYWLTRRYVNLKLNDKQNLLLLLLQPLLIPLSLVFIYGKLELGILFLMAITSIWFGVSNAAKEIVGELPIYKRERMYNLKILPYIFSKITVLSIIALIQIAIYVFVLSQKYDSSQSIYLINLDRVFLFMFYLTFSATLFGLFLSVVFKTTEQVMSIIPIVLIPQIIFAGVVSQVDTKGKEVLSYFMYGRWGTEGLARIQNDNQKFKTYLFNKNDTIAIIKKNNKTILKSVEDLSDKDTLEINGTKINNKPLYKSLYQMQPKVITVENAYLLVDNKKDKQKGDYQVPIRIDSATVKYGKPITYTKGKKYVKSDPLRTLGYYENNKLYNKFDSFKKNVFAITLLNIAIFLLTLVFLKRKDN